MAAVDGGIGMRGRVENVVVVGVERVENVVVVGVGRVGNVEVVLFSKNLIEN